MSDPRNGGGRKPTLEDVARAAGVSRALVSIVIRDAPGASEQTRVRVLQVADDLGYRPDVRARLLARSSTRLLGVVYRVDSLHHADLLAPIYEAGDACGYELILSAKTRRHDERRAVNTVMGYRCDAILLLGPELPEPEINRLGTSVPVIVVGRRLVHRGDGVETVRTDEDHGMHLAVEHLVSLGHTRIALVGGGPGTMASDRRRGYRSGMARAGLHDRIHIVEGGETGDAGLLAARLLLAEDPSPTAIMTYNDETAWGVMRAAAEVGLAVPRDLSVVGYDGTTFSLYAPPELTTIRQDAESLGRTQRESGRGTPHRSRRRRVGHGLPAELRPRRDDRHASRLTSLAQILARLGPGPAGELPACQAVQEPPPRSPPGWC